MSAGEILKARADRLSGARRLDGRSAIGIVARRRAIAASARSACSRCARFSTIWASQVRFWRILVKHGPARSARFRRNQTRRGWRRTVHVRQQGCETASVSSVIPFKRLTKLRDGFNTDLGITPRAECRRAVDRWSITSRIAALVEPTHAETTQRLQNGFRLVEGVDRLRSPSRTFVRAFVLRAPKSGQNLV